MGNMTFWEVHSEKVPLRGVPSFFDFSKYDNHTLKNGKTLIQQVVFGTTNLG